MGLPDAADVALMQPAEPDRQTTWGTMHPAPGQDGEKHLTALCLKGEGCGAAADTMQSFFPSRSRYLEALWLKTQVLVTQKAQGRSQKAPAPLGLSFSHPQWVGRTRREASEVL